MIGDVDAWWAASGESVVSDHRHTCEQKARMVLPRWSGSREVLDTSVITAGICYQERNRAAMVPGLRAMLTEEENDFF